MVNSGGEFPSLIRVHAEAGATTFFIDSYTKRAEGKEGSVPVKFQAQNLVMVPSETVSDNGIQVMTFGGFKKVGAGHVLAHEFGHAIVNTIMSEFNGEFRGVNFNKMPQIERLDWAIRFTNTLSNKNNKESGEGQHGRDLNTRPVSPPILGQG